MGGVDLERQLKIERVILKRTPSSKFMTAQMDLHHELRVSVGSLMSFLGKCSSVNNQLVIFFLKKKKKKTLLILCLTLAKTKSSCYAAKL